MRAVANPSHLIYRIARGPEEPFVFADWDRAGEDGTFGNRFDDPGGLLDLPMEQRFRVLYCATEREAAFAEVTARFRQRPRLNDALSRIDDDEETITDALAGAVDPDYPDHGLLEYDWLQRRRLGSTRISTQRSIIDVSHADTLAHLNEQIVPLLHGFGIEELDLSSITRSSPRILTQLAARYMYQQGFAGIRYVSRLGNNWECWALFEGRFHHDMGFPGLPVNIAPDNPALLDAAKRFGLTIEIMRGMNHYIRPWQE